ncbi:hypothetical protein Bra3105_06510 [Brachybacterium halotolerans subsp. kimchii]|uniref:hypothetical protein n=1 Tax=Brachybacterium halotolerans TaxID=2795215 RepID=UPI001E5583E7|nr:hypothetical protein [Brachybacterium halotolerans]UEJ83958.1 hypothetical protein Bra3105_06510 [Brachybacterium halotolerans subsp. kimchii]
MSKELRTQVRYASDADHCTARRLWEGAEDVHYPAAYYIRRLTMVRLDADGIPEVIPA